MGDFHYIVGFVGIKSYTPKPFALAANFTLSISPYLSFKENLGK